MGDSLQKLFEPPSTPYQAENPSPLVVRLVLPYTINVCVNAAVTLSIEAMDSPKANQVNVELELKFRFQE